MNHSELLEIIEYFRVQGAPSDQQMLIMLLREAQEMDGGVLSRATLETIGSAYGVKNAVLQALIRRIPSLRCEDVPHKLEICGTCRLGSPLRSFIEEQYAVKSGGCNSEAGFSYRITGCMKNCKNGPSIRWDGVLYPCANIETLKKLIEGSGHDK